MSSWIIHLADVPPEGLSVEGNVELDISRFDTRFVSNLTASDVSARIQRITGGYTLRGKLTCGVDLVCSRCLETFTSRITVPVDLRLMPQFEDDPGTYTCNEQHLELEPLLEEMLQLQIPMKPLCSEDCKGLCPVCGVNRNRGTCDCSKDAVDPRWNTLIDIRKEM